MSNINRRAFLSALGGYIVGGVTAGSALAAVSRTNKRRLLTNGDSGAGVPAGQETPGRPNIVIILADDMGFSDPGCYGSGTETSNIDQLAAGGLRFTQFYNCARCCPTRASLLTGLYPHQTGVGHLLENWEKPGYRNGLNQSCVTIAQLLGEAGYRTYHSGKWHVGGFWNSGRGRGNPIERGFDHAFCCNDGNAFAPRSIHYDQQAVEVGDGFYSTDAISDYAARMIGEHGEEHAGEPFFLHLCYTVPHFPLHAKPGDIAKYRGKFRHGWDMEREKRFAKQKKLGIFAENAALSDRDMIARPWQDVPEQGRDEWDLRMAVHAAMIDCMDQGVGRVLDAIKRTDAWENTLVLFFSDNGASAEFLDTWPDPRRGHKPDSITGTRESHRCLEVGWSNAANTPFREHKIWVHEGGIASPLIAHWPRGISARGQLNDQVAHVIDLMPTCLDVAGVDYPQRFNDRRITPLEGVSLAPAFKGKRIGNRMLAWEHEGNKAVRDGDWKLVAKYEGEWELYNLENDRTECFDLASRYPSKVRELISKWEQWSRRVDVLPWEQLPASDYRPTEEYRKKSEPPVQHNQTRSDDGDAVLEGEYV